MRYIIVFLVFTIPNFSVAQKHFEFWLTDGLYTSIIKEKSDKYFKPFGIGISLGYFAEYRLNRSNFITSSFGFNYTSTNQRAFRGSQEDIDDPIFRFIVSQSKANYEHRYFGADLSIKYQLFPSKKLPFLLTLGIRPTYIISDFSKEKIEHSTWLSVAGVGEGDERSEMVGGINYFENDIPTKKLITTYSIGLFGYRTDKFKIENLIEFGDITLSRGLNYKYERLAITINFSYYLNLVTIKNKKYKPRKRRKKSKR